MAPGPSPHAQPHPQGHGHGSLADTGPAESLGLDLNNPETTLDALPLPSA